MVECICLMLGCECIMCYLGIVLCGMLCSVCTVVHCWDGDGDDGVSSLCLTVGVLCGVRADFTMSPSMK